MQKILSEQDRSNLRLRILTERHQTLDDEVDELNAQAILLPNEQGKLKLLKILRLQAREAFDRFKKEEGIEE